MVVRLVEVVETAASLIMLEVVIRVDVIVVEVNILGGRVVQVVVESIHN